MRTSLHIQLLMSPQLQIHKRLYYYKLIECIKLLVEVLFFSQQDQFVITTLWTFVSPLVEGSGDKCLETLQIPCVRLIDKSQEHCE